jgi:hypothetical protein
VRVVGTRDTRGHETILVIGARGHVASDWNFADSQTGEVKGASCGNSRYARSRNNPGHWSQRTHGERLEFR